MSTIVRNDVHASFTVFGSFCAITSLTGLLYFTEIPKSPCSTTPLIQSIYCTKNGRLVPYCSSSFSTISGSWLPPIEVMSSSTGSDGSRYVRPNVRIDRPNRIMTRDTSLFRIILAKTHLFLPSCDPETHRQLFPCRCDMNIIKAKRHQLVKIPLRPPDLADG